MQGCRVRRKERLFEFVLLSLCVFKTSVLSCTLPSKDTHLISSLFNFRRKKKCIRYLEEASNGGGGGGNSNDASNHDDNLDSVGSPGDPMSPDSKNGDSDMEQSSDMGLSSPSFSLTSPGSHTYLNYLE